MPKNQNKFLNQIVSFSTEKWCWIKIKKVLPYWLTILLLLIFIQTGASFFGIKADANVKNNPEVLGVSAAVQDSVRGDLAPEVKAISPLNNPDLSTVNARSFLVFDLATGQTLLEKNSSQKLAIASLTKLMTGLVAYNNSSLNGAFTVSAKDRLNIRPALGLALGDEVSALDIFNSMLIGSCNDASLALARYVSQATGKDFMDLMNSQAKILGMENSEFSNPMGFDSDGNYSTAEDLKLLISAVEKLSAFTDLGRRVSYQFTGSLGKIYYTSATNILIKNHPDIQAIKTGFTNEANGAMVTKINIGSHQIIILVLDSQSRESDTLKLKEAVEGSFNWE